MTATEVFSPLERSFYQRHPATVAPELLGKVLVRKLEGKLLCGIIVETEAYSSEDPASHGFRGMTERNRAMFGPPGHAYIYRIHGLHYCFNITARGSLPAGAVLIRALEPIRGIEVMQQLRGRHELRALTTGPGKLTKALNIDVRLYGSDLTEPGELFVAEAATGARGAQCDRVAVSGRIGLSSALDTPWRFHLHANPYLSR